MARTSKKSLNSVDRQPMTVQTKTCWEQHDILDRYWPLAAGNWSGMFKGFGPLNIAYENSKGSSFYSYLLSSLCLEDKMPLERIFREECTPGLFMSFPQLKKLLRKESWDDVWVSYLKQAEIALVSPVLYGRALGLSALPKLVLLLPSWLLSHRSVPIALVIPSWTNDLWALPSSAVCFFLLGRWGTRKS